MLDAAACRELLKKGRGVDVAAPSRSSAVASKGFTIQLRCGADAAIIAKCWARADYLGVTTNDPNQRPSVQLQSGQLRRLSRVRAADLATIAKQDLSPRCGGVRPQAAVSAAFSFASTSLDIEVRNTRGLNGSSSGSTLSKVALRTSTNKADEFGGMVSPSLRMKPSSIP